MRWRKIHIFLGYLLIAAFISHSDFSLPDTGFEWALWAAFVLVTLSGIFGTYLAWSLQAKRGIDERVRYDRIPTRRAESGAGCPRCRRQDRSCRRCDRLTGAAL